MNEDSGGGSSSHKRKLPMEDESSPTKIAASFTNSKRGLFKDYTHLYKEEGKKDYPILLSPSSRNSKIDVLVTNKILQTIPGISYIKPIGNFLMKVFFNNIKDANNFLLNNKLLGKNEWQAKIPYDNLESQGIIRTPVELSEQDLLQNLKSTYEIIGVKRFTRKSGDTFVPTPTVLVTFLSSSRPDHVTYDRIWFDVSEYVKPVRQCFVCYKFGHSRGSCKSAQVCSICSENHFFKECTNKDSIKCSNCKGPHMAVSSSCPIKSSKLKEIRDRISGKLTYSSMAAKPRITDSSAPQFSSPILSKKINLNTPHKRVLYNDILNSDDLLNVLTKTVVDILKKKNDSSQAQDAISSKSIKELLINNLT